MEATIVDLETALPSEAPTQDELVNRAAALQQQLWADAPETDRDRRLTDRSIEAITDAGLLSLMTPRRFGGHQTDVRTVLDVTTRLGRGCGSTGWVAGVLNSGNFMVGLFSKQAQQDVWGDDPGARVANVLVPPEATVARVDGGLRITGKWGYASGSAHADWIALLLPVPGAQERPDMHIVLIPMSDLRIEDTWHVVGMRGTGSNHVIANEVFVPEHRILAWLPALNGELMGEHADEPLYRSSVSGVLQLFLLGSMIGAAQAALAYVLEKAPKRAIAASTYTSQVQSVPFQLDVAEAASMIDTAYLHASRIAATVDGHAARGEMPDLPTRARQRMDAAHVTEMTRKAMDLLMTAHGTSAFAEFNPLQRIWRDINMSSRHGGFGSHIPQEVYGKVLLGQDPRQTSYLL